MLPSVSAGSGECTAPGSTVRLLLATSNLPPSPPPPATQPYMCHVILDKGTTTRSPHECLIGATVCSRGTAQISREARASRRSTRRAGRPGLRPPTAKGVPYQPPPSRAPRAKTRKKELR